MPAVSYMARKVVGQAGRHVRTRQAVWKIGRLFPYRRRAEKQFAVTCILVMPRQASGRTDRQVVLV
jgi:hypothetical protein